MSERDQKQDALGRAAIGLAAIRVWLGIWFVIAALPKMPFAGLRHWDLPVQLQAYMKRLLVEGAHQAYQPVISLAVDHPNLCAVTLAGMEMLAGVLLVFGFFSRIGASLVVILSFNYWLATFRLGMVYCGFNLLLLVLALCLMAGDAGRFYGIDGLFAGD
jgi:uncharacterized membrane protein YphA (DoxX/SURF4 family)